MCAKGSGRETGEKTVIVLNALLVATLCVANYFYLSPVRGVSKAFCSGCFAALGVVNLAYVLIRGGHKGFAWAMALGLVLAMGGDLHINQNFVHGAVLFAAGHICYLIGYALLFRFRRQDLLWTLLFFVPGAVYLLTSGRLSFDPAALRWVCLGYALIISLMTGKAIGNFRQQPKVFTGVLMAGSVVFFFSDLMLLFSLFGSGGKLFDILCMSAYYPAQLMLAHGVFYAANPHDGSLPQG